MPTARIKLELIPGAYFYKFELDPGEYAVTVGMSNTWGNAGNPVVTLSADGIADVTSESYSNGSRTMLIDLTGATTNGNGKVELSVKGTTTSSTLQMTYITISDPPEGDVTDTISLPPYGEQALAGDKLPDDIYVGELVDGTDWFIDYRNLKMKQTGISSSIPSPTIPSGRKPSHSTLEAGENTIRIYNDNSWNVTYGGTQWLPGTTNLPNYTPNFDKFVITPMALDNAVQLAEEYTIDVVSTEYGVALADRNTVGENGEYTISMTPAEGKEIVNLLVNGVERKGDMTFDEASNTYLLKVTDVSEDQDVRCTSISRIRQRIPWRACTTNIKTLKEGPIPPRAGICSTPQDRERSRY